MVMLGRDTRKFFPKFFPCGPVYHSSIPQQRRSKEPH